MGLLIRLWICVFFAGLTLYKYIDKLNELTELRLTIPSITKELKEIQEKNTEFYYAIEQFENPAHLMELAKKPEFGHLKYPSMTDVLLIPEETIIDFP
jgi:hypothetical protein